MRDTYLCVYLSIISLYTMGGNHCWEGDLEGCSLIDFDESLVSSKTFSAGEG